MNTEIALDMMKSQASIKSMTTQVNSFTQSWKASEAQMKSAGDYLGASVAKYEGLGKAIDAQKSKIAKLKEEQGSLKGSTNATAEEFLKYQKQIDQASTRLKSMTAQQSRAKEAMTYQKSGLAGLQKAYALNNKAISAHVERLQAEGKTEEAQKAKVKGLESSLANLTSQYKKQRTETIGMARDFGTSSEQYLKAKTRLNETATAMAKTKTSANELREAMNKKPAGFLSGVKAKLDAVNDKASKTSHLFRTMFGANLASNAVTSALASIQAHFSSLTEAVNEYDDKQQTMQATWLTLTGSAKKGQAMVDMGNKLSVAFGQNINVVDELNQQFYHVLDNEPKTKELTSSVLTMSDAVGLSAENTKNLGLNFTHMMSSSKMQLGDFNHITDALPMYGKKLLEYEQKVQHNSKLTMSQLRDEMSAGKISAKDAENVMNELGAQYKKASENLMKTAPGMVRQIKAQAPALLDAVVGPIKKMRNPFIGQISKWVGEKSTLNGFKSIGNNIVKQIGRITNAMGGAKKINLTAGLDSGLKNINKMVTQLGNSVVKNKSTIKDFFSSMKVTGVTSFKILMQVLKDLLPVFKIVGGLAEKYPKTFAGLATSAMLSSKAIKALSVAFAGLSMLKTITKSIKEFSLAETVMATKTKALSAVTKAWTVIQKGLNLVMKANPLVRAVTIIMAVVSAFAYLYKTNKKFKSWINGLGKDFVKGFSSITKSAKSGVKKVGNFFGSMYKSASKHVSNLWNGTKKGFSNGWNTLSSYSKSGASKVGNWFNHMKTDTSKRAVDMFNAHKKTFKSGYSVLQNYTQTWHDIMTGKWDKVGSDLKNTANSITKFVKNIFSDLYNWLNKLTGGQLGKMVDFWKSKMGSIGDIVASAKASVHKHFVDLVRGVISPFNTLLSGIHKGISWILDKIGSGKLSGEWKIPVPSYATGTKDTHQGGLAQVNDGTGSNYREIYRLPNGQMGMFPAVHNMILPLPKGTSILNGDLSAKYAKLLGIPMYKSGVGDFFSGLWNGAKDVIEDTDKIIKAPEEFMKSVLKHFIGNTSSKISLAQDLITGLPNMVAKNAVKWIKKMFASISNPSGSGVERWRSVIKAVAGQMNFNISEGQVAKLLRQINTESGGNPTVKQGISDINSREGHPAQGLLQFIPSTFKTWALKGRTNILNGSDQIAAAINALNHGGEGGWGNIGNGHGWANGGIVSNWQYAQIAEHNKPEAVIPLDSAKDSRAWQVLKQVVDIKTAGTSSTATATTSDASNQIAELTNTVKAMANMLNTIIGLNADQVTATKGIVGYDKSRVYRQTATDTSLSGFQALH